MRIELTLDCVELDTTAAFWQATLGYVRENTIEDRYVTLTGEGPTLTLQRVPEPKHGKNRMHMDLLVDDLDAEVARLHALGATTVSPGPRQEFGQRWFVLADPEGNGSARPRTPTHDARRTDRTDLAFAGATGRPIRRQPVHRADLA
jgi:catechol-2,3-dioxygenase